MAAEFDWSRVAIEAGIAVCSGIGGAFAAVWKWGRDGAKKEDAVKEDYKARIEALREEMRAAMTSYEKGATARNDLFADQFREAFEGIRRQIDQNLLETERRFLAKPEFERFYGEYRRNQERVDEKLDKLLQRQ